MWLRVNIFEFFVSLYESMFILMVVYDSVCDLDDIFFNCIFYSLNNLG